LKVNENMLFTGVKKRVPCEINRGVSEQSYLRVYSDSVRHSST
jgi:hypothetical protein